MELTERIAALLDEKYTSDEMFADCFTVEIELKPGNRLNVFMDSDTGLSFERCQKMSRFLESHLDVNGWLTEKYVLEVSSPGIGRPLKFVRQFVKNIGRTVTVTLLDKTQKTGILLAVDDEKITIEYQVKEKIGKKNVVSTVLDVIPFEKIEKTVVKIVF